MALAPEFQLLIINAVIVVIAYFGIYPSLHDLTLNKMAANDIVLTSLSLLVAGGLFWGTEQAFALVLFSTNWFWFSFLTMFFMEIPLCIWFCRRNGIKLMEPDN